MSFIENPELRRAFTDFFTKESPVEKLRATENSERSVRAWPSDDYHACPGLKSRASSSIL